MFEILYNIILQRYKDDDDGLIRISRLCQKLFSNKGTNALNSSYIGLHKSMRGLVISTLTFDNYQ